MATIRDSSKCPWRGPSPYEEKDSGRFFGRKVEVRELVGHVCSYAVSVIEGESGAGKTSLLQAGLIPALRHRREREPRTRGMVLRLRDWAGASGGLAPYVFCRELYGEAERLRKLCDGADNDGILGLGQLCHDIKTIYAGGGPEQPSPKKLPADSPIESLGFLLRYVGRLCDVVEGTSEKLILVLDQVEELLGSGISGSGMRPDSDALGVIGNLVKYEDRVRIVISLRSEYISRLRALESFVPHLDKRTYAVGPMTVEAASGAIVRCAEGCDDVAIGKDTARRIIAWLHQATEIKEDTKIEFPSEDKVLLLPPDQPVDILRVQALFRDVYLSADGDSTEDQLATERVSRDASAGSSPALSIDWACFQEYGRSLMKHQAAKGGLGICLQDIPMLRHIDTVFSLPDGSGMSEIRALGLQKRIVARMGDILASPRGFKRHLADADLIFRALRTDLRTDTMAGIHLPTFRELLVHASRGLALRPEDGGSSADAPDPAVRRFPRKVAKSDVVQERAVELAIAGFRAVARLAAKHILKPQSQDGRGCGVYSLLHDGFGPALDAWGEVAQTQPHDVLYSVVGTYGTHIDWEKTPVRGVGELVGTAWIGCYIENTIFEKVTFAHCRFHGTWFRNCTFVDCTFKHCWMPAVGFADCEWERMAFEKVFAPGLFVGAADKKDAVWRGKTCFRKCNLTSAEVQGVNSSGEFCLEDCIARYAQFHRLASGSRCNITVRGCDLYGSFFPDYASREHRVNEQQPPADKEQPHLSKRLKRIVLPSDG